jgi:hypothetical protein
VFFILFFNNSGATQPARDSLSQRKRKKMKLRKSLLQVCERRWAPKKFFFHGM